MLAKFTENINKRIPFSFVKFGDGELLCMSGTKGRNCDGQVYGQELANALKVAYRELSENPSVHITHWPWGLENVKRKYFKGKMNYADYEALLLVPGNQNEQYLDFWRAIKERGTEVIWLGNINHLRLPAYFGEIDIRTYSNSNAWGDYQEILDLINTLNKEHILIFSLGLASKVLIADALNINPGHTCIDAGSAMDPLIFESNTRTGQLSRADALRFFIL